MLSYGDRLVLIMAILTSLHMFMLSLFEIPKGVRKRLDYFRSHFFWQSAMVTRKNTDYPDGISSVDRKTKEVLVLRSLK
jgi:hypothetical protein